MLVPEPEKPKYVYEYHKRHSTSVVVIKRNEESVGYINIREGDSWTDTLRQLELQSQQEKSPSP